MTRPVAVAITGGIGAGKSEALAAFARMGAATVSSDEIVHELLGRDEVRRVIVERFGNGVVAPDGRLDRGAIATVVFNDREALDWLEQLLHPLVAVEYLQWREQLGALPVPPAVCVTEVPLLYEAGADERFDKVDGRFEKIDARFGQVDERFDKVGERFDKIDQRFDKIEAKFDARFEKVDERFGKVDERLESLSKDISGIRELLASAKVWAISLYAGLAGTMLYVMARGFKWF